jgi:hypothetical protein
MIASLFWMGCWRFKYLLYLLYMFGRIVPRFFTSQPLHLQFLRPCANLSRLNGLDVCTLVPIKSPPFARSLRVGHMFGWLKSHSYNLPTMSKNSGLRASLWKKGQQNKGDDQLPWHHVEPMVVRPYAVVTSCTAWPPFILPPLEGALHVLILRMPRPPDWKPCLLIRTGATGGNIEKGA